MRITASMLAREVTRLVQRGTESLNRSLERLSTGRRVNRASDDPIGTILILRLRRGITQVEGDSRRLEEALMLPRASDAALNQAISLMQRVRELMLRASNDTLTASERTALAEEMSTLREELVHVANTRLGDRYLFAGTKVHTPPFVLQSNGEVVYQGNEDSMSLALSDGESITLTLPGQEVFQAQEDVFALLQDAITALRNGEADTLRESLLERLDAGLQQMLDAAARLGAQTNWGERTLATLNWYQETLRESLSRVQDADVTEEVTTWRLREATLQATLLAASRILPLSLVDFMA
jgi:flagellar hook-associated protein 3 FlgL